MAAPHESNPPRCPGCHKTMRLVGRERHATAPKAEVLTFECDCGQLVTTTLSH